ncbi:MAG: hypothetical protein HY899_10765 [Deltaproteobacteria bacterium]|nr:hypothetical protein [Deltaproteobacteria bacterium]
MPRALVTVKLSGRWGLPEFERELARGPLDIDLPEGVTGEGLLHCLAERCDQRFRRKALKADGKLRAEVRLFVRSDVVQDPAAPLGDKLGDGAEISIVLLKPLVGG